MLVRHGGSTWVAEGRVQARKDPPLSPLSERQALFVADRLAAPLAAPPLPVPSGPPSGVWHSPLARARATAETIAARQPTPVALHAAPDFTEIAQGAWEGRRHEEIVAEDGAALEAWRREPTRYHAPRGEPLLEAAARVRAALRELVAAIGAASLAPGGTSLDAARRASPAAVAPASASPRAPMLASPVPGYRSAPATAGAWAIVVAHDGIFRLVLLTLLVLPYERFWSFPFVLCGISVLELRDGRAVLRAHNLSDHLAPLAVQEAAAAAEAKGDRRGAL